MIKSIAEADALAQLRRELVILCAIGYSGILIGFVWLGVTQDWRQAGLWLIPAASLWAYADRHAYSLLDSNRMELQAPLYPSLGWGNRITLARGWLIAWTGGFLLTDQHTDFNVFAPAASYSMAAILDRCDSFLARRSRQVSLLGGELDIRFDALGLVVAPFLAILQGRLHVSFLLLSVAFYGYRWGLQRRRQRGLPILPLPDNLLRRTLAGFQMGFVAAALWPWLNADFTRIAGIAFMLPVLFGFITDWLVVCGTLSPQHYQRIAESSHRTLQPGLRLLSGGIGFAAAPSITDGVGIALFAILLPAMVLTGLAARWAALLILFNLGWTNSADIPPLAQNALIFSCSWLLLLGSGRCSLYSCGENWLQRYDGA